MDGTLALRRPAQGLTGPRCANVEAALRERALVWTWAMRGTLHLVRAADGRWLLGLLGPSFAARGRPEDVERFLGSRA